MRLSLTGLLVGCDLESEPVGGLEKPAAAQEAESVAIEVDRNLEFDDIDPAIYFAANAGEDPFAEVYEGFRRRKAAAIHDPEMPPPIEPYQTVHRSRDRAWGEVEELLPFDWDGAAKEAPRQVEGLLAALKIRRAFDHPDLKILEVMIGSGATLPAHSGGAPGVWLPIHGEAEVTLGAETQRVTPGAKMKLEPFSIRQIRVVSEEPLRMLWIRWAPHGDHRYIQAGYYLTGSNQHIQPRQATIPADFEFWPPNDGLTEIEESRFPDTEPSSPFLRGQWEEFTKWISELGPDGVELYPGVPMFGHENETPWLDIEAIRNSNFMWAKDVLSTGALLDRWAEVVRMEGLFQARYSDGSWDFNISQQAWGSGARYVEHSHSIPEFYYMLSGRVQHWNGDEVYDAEPGDIFMTNSYQNHESRVEPNGEVWRSYGATWAPGGDRTVFDRPFFLLAPLPEQPARSALPAEIAFH